MNDWIGDAITEGIPAIEDNLLDWKRRASMVKRRWTDFEKAVREGETGETGTRAGRGTGCL